MNMSTGQNLCRTIDENGTETIGPPPADEPSDANDASSGVDAKKEEGDKGAKADDGTGAEKDGADAAAAPSPKKPEPGTVLGHQGEVMNVLSKETQIKLRKNQYPFVCKRHFEVTKEKKPPVVKPTSVDTPALPPKERKLIDFRNKVYVAPLTTVGNLPFRRVMKRYGADITCGEMALADQLLSGKPSEWALLKRHPCEDVFGVQIAAGHADQWTRVAEILTNEESMEIDFVDMNLGCPIDLVCEKGAGAKLMLREKKLRGSLEGMLGVLNCPVTIKMRMGWSDAQPFAHELQPKIQGWGLDGISAFMVSDSMYCDRIIVATQKIRAIISHVNHFYRIFFLSFMVEAVCSATPDLLIGITFRRWRAVNRPTFHKSR